MAGCPERRLLRWQIFSSRKAFYLAAARALSAQLTSNAQQSLCSMREQSHASQLAPKFPLLAGVLSNTMTSALTDDVLPSRGKWQNDRAFSDARRWDHSGYTRATCRR